ncbi:hypothetical protein P7K49_036429 [Saguinus oedipus]|uniref:Uncharacterized protein n=1 Tax=Saguinus oedipus TaxID=9490 RepID=A0ABQ9TK27_SAGOE|nr:hypothetical protein P7K49_036429 [Saguinus oedipus]
MEVEKAPWGSQWPLESCSRPVTLSIKSCDLRLLAAREAERSRPGGPDYGVVWEELKASIFALASASERHRWEQNHRKRKKPARERLVGGSATGQRECPRRPGSPGLQRAGLPGAHKQLPESLTSEFKMVKRNSWGSRKMPKEKKAKAQVVPSSTVRPSTVTVSRQALALGASARARSLCRVHSAQASTTRLKRDVRPP